MAEGTYRVAVGSSANVDDMVLTADVRLESRLFGS